MIICAAICMSLAAVSCMEPIVVDDPVQPGFVEEKPVPAPDSMTFTVSLEQGDTKSLLSGTEVLWSDGDKIKVFNATHPSGQECTLIEGIGEKTGKFSGPVMDGSGPFYAVFPASAAGTLDTSTGIISLTVPDTQAYVTAWDMSPEANFSAGTTDDLANGFTFKNLFGVLKFTITGTTTTKIGSIVVTSKGSTDVLNGAFSLSFTGGVPITTSESGQTAESFRKLTLDCRYSPGEGISLSSAETELFLVVPAGTLDAGMTVEVVDLNNKVMVLNAGAYDTTTDHFINRSHIRPMPSFNFAAQYNAAFLQSDVASGAFTGVAATATQESACTYVPSSGQYSFMNTASTRQIRIQDWNAGFALTLSTPYEIKAGTKVNVDVTAYGVSGISSTSSTTEMRVLKVVGDRAWIVDPNTGNGFIMMLVEG